MRDLRPDSVRRPSPLGRMVRITLWCGALAGGGCEPAAPAADDIAVATSNLTLSGATAVTFGDGVIAAGNAHTCALVGNSGVECWGDNTNGQLGSASAGGFQPVAVSHLTSGVVWVAAGAAHTCAI